MNEHEHTHAITQRAGEPAWQKSSRSSDPDLAQCVEVSPVGAGVSWVVQARA